MPLFATSTSTRPSLSRSPTASPRALYSFRKAGPASALTLRYRPPSLWNSIGGCR